MKILITGSSGFVGTHLIKKLSEIHDIVSYDIKNGQDIFNKKLLLSKLKGVELVIHLAAFISAKESWEAPEEYFKNNALGTLTVINNSLKAGVSKIIFFSSAAVKATPLTPYAVSKIAAEEIVKLYSDKINTIIIRPENIYGPGQKEAYGYVIHNFIKAAKSGESIKIFGTGNQIRDFIYIDDVIQVIHEVIKKVVKTNTTISLGSGKGTSIITLANNIIKTVGNKTEIKYLPKRVEPVKSVADTEKLTELKIKTNKFKSLNQGIKYLI